MPEILHSDSGEVEEHTSFKQLAAIWLPLLLLKHGMIFEKMPSVLKMNKSPYFIRKCVLLGFWTLSGCDVKHYLSELKPSYFQVLKSGSAS